MTVEYYETDLNNSTGQILASWFITNPNGPTAFAIGFTELEHERRLFYRWLHFTGGNTWLLNPLPDEIDMWDGDFGHILFNSIIKANNHFLAAGGEEFFLSSIPQIVITNGNPAISAAFFELLKIGLLECDWGKELYFVEKYGNNLFPRYEEEFRDIFERLKRDPNASEDGLEALWHLHSHRKGFQEWKPNQYTSSHLTDALFERWKNIISNRSFSSQAIYNFCQMWVGSYETAVSSGLLKQINDKSQTLDTVLSFFEKYNLPLVPQFVDQAYVKKEMGFF